MRKQIGIVGYVDANQNHFGVGLAYILYFSDFGDVTVISPTETHIRKDLDLIVIPGGPDVDWKRYLSPDDKEGLSLYTGRPCNIRERFDHVLLPKYIAAGVPIFGICRGHQSLAVHFGARLTQDMYHETNKSGFRKEEVHSIEYPRELLSKFMQVPYQGGKKNNPRVFRTKVNSIHHQMVANCPDNAVVLANYVGVYDDNAAALIEALYYPEHKAITVQWHPEEIRDAESKAFIEHLLTLK